jgi:hypothetical protein
LKLAKVLGKAAIGSSARRECLMRELRFDVAISNGVALIIQK